MTGPKRLIRPWRDDDIPFIKNSWRMSFLDYRHDDNHPGHGFISPNPTVLWATKRHFHANMDKRIRRLFHRGTFLVACDPADESEIMGWVCYQPGVIHYIYVKEAYRRTGLGKELIASTGQDTNTAQVTHWTRVIAQLGLAVRYNPGLLGEDKKFLREASREEVGRMERFSELSGQG